MKKFMVYLFFLIVLISVVGCKPNNVDNINDIQIKNSARPTNAEVINIVKNFENNQNLTNLNIEYDDEDNIYSVENEITRKSWDVKAGINKVIEYMNSNEIDHKRVDEGGVYSKAQCEAIAITYLNNKNICLIGYENTPKSNWSDDGCYSFYFYKILDTNIDLMSDNSISVSVNSNTGNISLFMMDTEPDIFISSTPTLTEAQVTNIINQLYGAGNVKDLKIGGYGYEEKYKTIIRIADVNNEAWILIDAYTHNVLGAYAFGGGNTSKGYSRSIKEYNALNNGKKKVVIKTKPYKVLTDEELAKLTPTIKDIKFILLKTKNKDKIKYFNIKKDDKKISFEKADNDIVYLNIKGKKIIFHNGSCFAFVNNKTNNMGGNFIIENNKIKIPLEFAKKIGIKNKFL